MKEFRLATRKGAPSWFKHVKDVFKHVFGSLTYVQPMSEAQICFVRSVLRVSHMAFTDMNKRTFHIHMYLLSEVHQPFSFIDKQSKNCIF